MLFFTIKFLLSLNYSACFWWSYCWDFAFLPSCNFFFLDRDTEAPSEIDKVFSYQLYKAGCVQKGCPWGIIMCREYQRILWENIFQYSRVRLSESSQRACKVILLQNCLLLELLKRQVESRKLLQETKFQMRAWGRKELIWNWAYFWKSFDRGVYEELRLRLKINLKFAS